MWASPPRKRKFISCCASQSCASSSSFVSPSLFLLYYFVCTRYPSPFSRHSACPCCTNLFRLSFPDLLALFVDAFLLVVFPGEYSSPHLYSRSCCRSIPRYPHFIISCFSPAWCFAVEPCRATRCTSCYVFFQWVPTVITPVQDVRERGIHTLLR